MKKCRRSKFYLRKIGLFLLMLIISLVLIYNFQIIPVLSPLVKAQAITEITKEVHKIIGYHIQDSDTNYSNIASLKYDQNGNVVSLQLDTPKIAKLSSLVVEETAMKLGGLDKIKVSIPLGNLSGGALFTGKGPDIDINLAISKKITCDMKNEFLEQGINQTIHRVIATVSVETYALIPCSTQTFSVDTEYCISETVIVGKIPEAFTQITRQSESDNDISESDIDDIYDFGAENYYDKYN